MDAMWSAAAALVQAAVWALGVGEVVRNIRETAAVRINLSVLLDMVGRGRPGRLRVLNHQMLNGHDTRVIGRQWCGAVNRRCGSVREDPGRVVCWPTIVAEPGQAGTRAGRDEKLQVRARRWVVGLLDWRRGRSRHRTICGAGGDGQGR